MLHAGPLKPDLPALDTDIIRVTSSIVFCVCFTSYKPTLTDLSGLPVARHTATTPTPVRWRVAVNTE